MKKIRAGLYVYRDHTVEFVEGLWLIKHRDERDPHDAANTKREAAEMIDYWGLCEPRYHHENAERAFLGE